MKSSKKKKRIKELYRKGYNSSEIARIITKENRAEGIFKVTTREAIKKCIQRNFKEYKKEHKINAAARKEVIKAVDYESKKYIGDKALILKNRSVYETKKDGDIVLKKEKDINFVFAGDMPKRLVNENKVKNKKSDIELDKSIFELVNKHYGELA